MSHQGHEFLEVMISIIINPSDIKNLTLLDIGKIWIEDYVT